jgi:ribose 5-phosphate isomerase B
MKVAIASDHAGLSLKRELAELLDARGHEVKDFGTYSGESVDYPDFASQVGRAVGKGEVERGVLVCGTGIGISIAANRNPKVRAALVHDVTSARLSRAHNDANVVAFGQRVIGAETAREALKVFLSTNFEGGRHEARVAKLSKGCMP